MSIRNELNKKRKEYVGSSNKQQSNTTDKKKDSSSSSTNSNSNSSGSSSSIRDELNKKRREYGGGMQRGGLTTPKKTQNEITKATGLINELDEYTSGKSYMSAMSAAKRGMDLRKRTETSKQELDNIIKGYGSRMSQENRQMLQKMRDALDIYDGSLEDAAKFYTQFGNEEQYKEFVTDSKLKEKYKNSDYDAVQQAIKDLNSTAKGPNKNYASVQRAKEEVGKATGLGMLFPSMNAFQNTYNELEDKEKTFSDEDRFGNAAYREQQWLKRYGQSLRTTEVIQRELEGIDSQLKTLGASASAEENERLQQKERMYYQERDSQFQQLQMNSTLSPQEIRRRQQQIDQQLRQKYGIKDRSSADNDKIRELKEQREALANELYLSKGRDTLNNLDRNLDYEQVSNKITADMPAWLKSTKDFAEEVHDNEIWHANDVNLTMLTDDERKKLRYMWNTQGEQAVNDYINNYLSYDLNARYSDAANGIVSDWAKDNPVGMSALSVGTNLGQGFAYLETVGQRLGNSLSGNPDKPVDWNRPIMQGTYGFTTTTRDTVANDVLGGGVAAFLYQTGMSMADSAAVMAMTAGLGSALGGISTLSKGAQLLVNNAGTSLLGGAAATTTAQQAKDAGATDSQALSFGLLSGAAETLFENVSLGNIQKIAGGNSAVTLSKFIKNVLQQGGVEASEEVFTTLANTLSEAIIMGDKSTYNQNIQMYLDQGYSQEEAEQMASMDWWMQLKDDALGGFLSGGAFGGGGSFVSNIRYKGSGQNIINIESADAVIDSVIANISDENNEAVQLAKDLKENPGKIDAGSIGTLQGMIDDYAQTSDQANEEANEVRKVLSSNNIIDRMTQGIRDERAAALEQQNNEITLDETAKRSVDIQTGKEQAVQSGSQQSEGYTQKISTNDTAQNNAQKTHDVNVTRNGKAVKLSTRIEVTDTDSIDNSLTMKLSDGTEVSSNDVQFRDKKTQELIAQTKGLVDDGWTVDQIQSFIDNYDGKTDPGRYAAAFKAAAFRASVDNSNDTFKNSLKGFTSDIAMILTGDQIRAAYTVGLQRNDAGIDIRDVETQTKAAVKESAAVAQETQTNIDKAVEAKQNDKGQVKQARRSNFTYEHNVKDSEMNETQKKNAKNLKALEHLSKALGIKIVARDSIDIKTKDGKVIKSGANGQFVRSKGTVYVSLDAENPLRVVLSHELTHFIQAYSPSLYEELKSYIRDYMNAKVDSMAFDETVEYYMEKYNLDRNSAIDEVVADACDMFLDSKTFTQEMADEIAKTHRNLAEKIRDFIEKLLKDLASFFSEDFRQSNASAYLQSTLSEENLNALKTMWDKALTNAVRTYNSLSESEMTDLEKNGFEVDEDTQSVSYSAKSYMESDYIAEREKMAKQIADKLGVSQKKAEKWIDDVTGIANTILGEPGRLDYTEEYEGFTSFRPNSEYDHTVDFSLICAKRRLYTGTMNLIRSMIPNAVLLGDDIARIRELMVEKGDEVACGTCYVETSRLNQDKYIADFIREYQLSQRTGKPIEKENSKHERKVLKATKANDYRTFIADPMLNLSVEMFASTDKLNMIRRNHPELALAYDTYMNKLGTSKPKAVETRVAYKHEILDYFTTASRIAKFNGMGGLRINSFSDFETPHLIDMMQVVLDMAKVGLKSHAYTKVPNFAWVFGDTGIKINCSLFGKGTGVDADGNLVFDDVEGMPHDEAFKLRDRYGKNVGTILVGMNEAHIRAALLDPRIDMVIPYHKSQMTDALAARFGLENYTDFTNVQNEVDYKTGSKVDHNINVIFGEATGALDENEMVWDFSKSELENTQAYLDLCEKLDRQPKFPQFLDRKDGKYIATKGYYKMLVDFRIYDNNGIAAPHETVTPNFNMDEANRVLDEYEGGADNLPVDREVAKKFVDEYNESHEDEDVQYSIKRGMTDAERFEELKDATIKAIAPSEENSKITPDELNKLKSTVLKDSRNAAKELIKKFKVKGKEYSNKEISFSFYFGRAGSRESVHIQGKKSYGYLRFAKMLESFSEIVSAAKPIEIHGDKYEGTIREDTDLQNMYVLMSAFEDDGIVPVQFEIKEYGEKENIIYVAVTLGEIEKDVVMPLENDSSESSANGVHIFHTYNLGDLLRNVNIQDVDFLKYVPDGFLDANKIKAKQSAIQEEQARISRIPKKTQENNKTQNSLKEMTIEQIDADYLNAVKSGDKATAQRMVDEYAKMKGYSVKVYHISPNSFTVFNTRAERYGEKGFNNMYYFTPNKAWARAFGREELYLERPKPMELYLNPGSVLDATSEEYMMTVPEWFAFFEKNGIEITDAMRKNFRGNAMPNANTQKLPLWALIQYDFESGSDYETDYVGAFRRAGYDSIHMPDVVHGRGYIQGDTYVVFDKNRAKSANAITYDNHKKPVPLSQRFNKNEDDIRYSLKGMTDEQIDANYMKAVESGDMKVAQAMVDEYARMKGYTVKAYHGTPNKGFTIFDNNKKIRGRAFGDGSYFASVKGAAEYYAKNWKVYDNDKKTLVDLGTPGIYDVYLKIGKDALEFDWANFTYNGRKVGSAGRMPMIQMDIKANPDKDVVVHNIKDGADVTTTVYVIKNPNQIKSADPVTYDKNGNIIPLSQRFNEAEEDIYYSLKESVDAFAEIGKIKTGESTEVLMSIKDTDSMSNREILAGAYEVVAQTDKERRSLELYRESIETLDGIQAKLDEARKEIHTIMFTKGGRAQMGDRLAELQDNVKKWEKQLTLWDGKLIRLQASKPIRDIVVRARAAEAKKTASKYRERITSIRQTNAARDVRRKLKKLYNDLKKRALKPTENKYIPAPLMETMLNVLETIDFRGGNPDTKIHAQLTDMYMRYEALKNDPDFLTKDAYDEQLSSMLQQLVDTVGETYVRDMSAAQLNETYTILRAIAYTLNQKVKQIGRDTAISNYELGTRAIEEIRTAKGPLSKITKIYNNGSLSPMRFFRMISGWAKNSVLQDLADQLNEGQRKQNDIMMRGYQLFDEFVGTRSARKEFDAFHGKGKNDRILLTNTDGSALLDTNGKEVYITHDMLVALYLHSMNEDNLRHVLGGKMRIPDIDAYVKGNHGSAYENGHRVQLSEEVLTKLFNENLTEYDKKYAQVVYDFFNTFSKQIINETSMALNGYKKAEVDNYFPIHVDSDFLGAQFDSLIKDGTLEGMGILKQRVNSSKPIYLEGASDAVIRNLNSVAKYGGLAIAVKNFQRVYNVTTIATDEFGEVTDTNNDSVQNALNDKWGKMSKNYVENMLSDLQFGSSGRVGWDSLVNKFFTRARGMFAQATLGMNLSVTLKQAASYPTAAAELGWSSLAKALLQSNKKVDLNKLAQYTPIMWVRSHGFVNTELGDAVNPQDWSAKVPALMGWIQAMDIATVTKLALATEYYIRQTQPNLKVGSDEYWTAVAEKFNRVVELTQPNYSVMQRPEVLRSQNAILRSLTMFMTQRLQNYNILFDAVGEYTAARNSSDAAWAKEAGMNLRRAVTSQAVAAAVIASMTMAVNMLMHRMKRYRDDDDEITVESFMGTFFSDMISTVAGSFLGGSEIYEIINNFTNGTTYDVLDAPNITMVNDLIGAFEKFGQITQKMSKMQQEAEENGETYDASKDTDKLLSQLGEIGTAIAKFFGIPVENGRKLVEGVYYYSLDAANGTLWESDIDKSKSDYYKDMAKALAEGDKDKYQKAHDKALEMIVSDSKYEGSNAKVDAENKIVKGIQSYLVDNDERIRQAAEAMIAANTKEVGRIRKEMIAEGYPESAVVGAINTMTDKLKKGDTDMTNGYVEEYAPDLYETSDIVSAYRAGSEEALEDIIDYFITEKGMSEAEARKKVDETARKEIRSGLYNAIDSNDIATAKEYISDLQNHGAENKDIASSLTSTYKDMYLDYYIHSEKSRMSDLEKKLSGLGLTKKDGSNYYGADTFKSWISKYQEGTKATEQAKTTSPREYYETVKKSTSSRKGLITAMSKKYHPLWEDYYLHDDTENLKKLEDQLRSLNITDTYGRNHYDDSLFEYWREQVNK